MKTAMRAVPVMWGSNDEAVRAVVGGVALEGDDAVTSQLGGLPSHILGCSIRPLGAVKL
jgi:hypothetical protein